MVRCSWCCAGREQALGARVGSNLPAGPYKGLMAAVAAAVVAVLDWEVGDVVAADLDCVVAALDWVAAAGVEEEVVVRAVGAGDWAVAV